MCGISLVGFLPQLDSSVGGFVKSNLMFLYFNFCICKLHFKTSRRLRKCSAYVYICWLSKSCAHALKSAVLKYLMRGRKRCKVMDWQVV